MGQKVNPHGLRVGVIKDWDSRWYAENDFADYLVEDYKIRKYLKDKLNSAGVSKIEIERASDRVRVIIHTAKPGVIIGKGGMGPDTEYACKEYKAIHCVFPAGNAVVAATEVEEIVDAQWKDLGMPETLWHCRVREFGPLIVSIDTEGRNLFEENKVIFNERKEKAIGEICKQVSFIK